MICSDKGDGLAVQRWLPLSLLPSRLPRNSSETACPPCQIGTTLIEAVFSHPGTVAGFGGFDACRTAKLARRVSTAPQPNRSSGFCFK